MSKLGTAVGPVAAPVRLPEGGIPSQIPWFQTSQPGPAAQPLSAALFPDYLDAALLDPSVSGKGADASTVASLSSASSPVAPASPASAWLPAYLTSTDPEGGNSVGAARSVLASSPKGPARAVSDGKPDPSTSFVVVPAAPDEAFLVVDHAEDLQADNTTRAISEIVPGNGEKEAHLVDGFVAEEVSQKAADSARPGSAVACADQLFAALGSQPTSEASVDHLPPHAAPWRQWLILLTVFASGAINSQGTSRPTARRQEHFSGLRVRSDRVPC
jgi:hypothetical protein